MPPPMMLGYVWRQMSRYPDKAFVFADKKACLVYYPPIHSVVYLIGDFTGNRAEITAEIRRAFHSMLN